LPNRLSLNASKPNVAIIGAGKKAGSKLVKGLVESGKICSVEVEENSEDNSEKKALLCKHLTTPLKDAAERR
jgi:hypothetical protein